VSETIRLNFCADSRLSEPRLLAIPEGWFLMGSETGQENERPVHRVWVDAFDWRNAR